MANATTLRILNEALDADNPSIWHKYKRECHTRQSVFGDAERTRQDNDLTNADFSSRIFNSRVYSDHEYTQREEKPETVSGALFLNRTAHDDYYFSHMNLSGCRLERAIVRGCKFYNSNLGNIKAKNVTFAHCPFSGDAEGVWFKDAVLPFAIFQACGFGFVRFERADLTGAEFRHCVFTDDMRKEIKLHHPFYNATLDSVKFLDCDLSLTGITVDQLKQCASIKNSILPAEAEQRRAEIQAAIDKRNQQIRNKKHDRWRAAIGTKRAERKAAEPTTESERQRWLNHHFDTFSAATRRWDEAERQQWSSAKCLSYTALMIAAEGDIFRANNAPNEEGYITAVNARFAALVTTELQKHGRLSREGDVIQALFSDNYALIPSRTPTAAERPLADSSSRPDRDWLNSLRPTGNHPRPRR